jgi:glucokinase
MQAAASLAMGTSFGDLRDVEEAARQWEQGSAKALALFTEYGRAVGEGLATLLGLYRPSHVIIGGSGSQFFSYYEDSMRHTVSETSKWHPPHTIGPTELDDFGGAIGAAVLALKSIGR